MVIFPLAPGQTIAQIWSNGARGGANKVGGDVFLTAGMESGTQVSRSRTCLTAKRTAKDPKTDSW